jgi:putative tricarboxylic transport membrane protein
MTSRNSLAIAIVAAPLLALAVPAQALDNIEIMAPAAPGGGWDQTARALQHALASVEPTLSVQVENVPGAAGTIGLARFVGSERGNPDALLITGNTMLSAITTTRTSVTLADTTPIARLTGEPEVIVVPAASPFRTLADLIAAFRASPETVTWGGGSAGGTDDLLVRLLAEQVGVAPSRANYIAFAGGGPALAALLGGQVTAGVSGYSEFAGQIEAGALRALALSAPSTSARTIAPTLREQGVDLELANWRAVVAAPGVTDAERDALTKRMAQVAASDVWRAILAKNGWDDMFLAGAPFRQFLIVEQQRVDAALQRLSGSNTAEVASARPVTSWVTPMTLPIAATAGVAILGLAMMIRARTAAPSIGLQSEGRAMILLAALLVHAISFPLLGFIAASTLLFAGAARLFESRHWVTNLSIGLVIAVVLFVVFTRGLGVHLPVDPVTRWILG